MAGKPAFQFYPGDWMKAPELGMCSPATRGIWVDLLCAIWNGDGTGAMRGTVRGLAQVCRCTAEEMQEAIDELEGYDVADVERDGQWITITSRRMSRDLSALESKRARDRRYYRRHSDGHSDAHSDGHSDAHSQKIEEEVEEEEEEVREETRDDFAEAWDAYGKKVAKAQAERAWRRLNRGDRAAALERIPGYVKATPDVQYRANFATWLNGRRWEDETPKNGAAPKLSSPAACAGCNDALGVDFTRYQGRAYCDACYAERAWAKQEVA